MPQENSSAIAVIMRHRISLRDRQMPLEPRNHLVLHLGQVFVPGVAVDDAAEAVGLAGEGVDGGELLFEDEVAAGAFAKAAGGEVRGGGALQRRRGFRFSD